MLSCIKSNTATLKCNLTFKNLLNIVAKCVHYKVYVGTFRVEACQIAYSSRQTNNELLLFVFAHNNAAKIFHFLSTCKGFVNQECVCDIHDET